MAPAVLPLSRHDPSETVDPEVALLDRVFFALSDPVRREILQRLDENPLLVSELAAPFDISLQAVSRHIQVLVRAGLVRQERTGRISRCSLDAGPIFAAAVWINRYSKYWQAQFDTLAAWLDEIERRKAAPATPALPRPKLKRSRRRA
jgi:DNA-binding transcriptional ArsR family regulator